LILLALMLLVAITLLARPLAWPVTAGLLAVYNIAAGYAAWRAWLTKPLLAKCLAVLALAFLGAGFAALYAHLHLPKAQAGVVMVAALPMVLALAGVVAASVARRSVSAGAWAWVCGAALVLTLAVQLLKNGQWPWQIELAVLLSMLANAAVVLFVLVMLGWIVLAAAQLVFAFTAGTAHVLHVLADRDTYQAMRTAMLCMMVATSMFAIVTISLWTLLVSAGLPQDVRQVCMQLWVEPVFKQSEPCITVADFTQNLIIASSAFFSPALGSLAVIGISLAFATLPALAAEVSPRTNAQDAPRMGRWVDVGLKTVGWVVVAVSVLYVLVLAWQGARQLGLPGQSVLERWFGESSQDWLRAAAWALAASATSLIALGPALSKSLGRLRVVLDVALDVDNYFREHPRTSNPRSRIYARYLALLSHLRQQGYARIVIVAHSQGTVITADVLRLMHAQPPQTQNVSRFAMQLPATHLVTAGSPLRQLYRVRFPHLYRWIDDKAATGQPQEHWQQLARHFGLTRWINIYRSGDYVGRAFWRAPPRYNTETQSLAVSENRAEMCMGAGGHTHYFDDTAARLAQAVCHEIIRA
jgi:hypothetical protein